MLKNDRVSFWVLFKIQKLSKSDVLEPHERTKWYNYQSIQKGNIKIKINPKIDPNGQFEHFYWHFLHFLRFFK